MSRPPLDLTLYLVTDAGLCGDAGVVQLQDPHSSDAELVGLGTQLRSALPASTGLIVNDRVHLVASIGADGAHVGQGDLDPRAAREIIGADAYLGLSVQTLAHVEQARRVQPDVAATRNLRAAWEHSA